MEVSKIQFSQATKAALVARPMSKTAKSKLRRERIKDYVRSNAAGTLLSQNDLAVAGGYDPTKSTGYAFVGRMVKHGIIVKQDEGQVNGQFSWSVKGDARTTKPGIHGVSVVEVPELPKLEPVIPTQLNNNPDINSFVSDMQKLGVKFTITITNKEEV